MEFDQGIQIYIEESRDLLAEMEEALLALEERPGDMDLLNRIFRAAHTIKGSGGIFGFDHIVEFTHVLETLLDRIRCGEVSVTGEVISLLFRSRDHLSGMVESIMSSSSFVSAEETRELLRVLEGCCGDGGEQGDESTGDRDTDGSDIGDKGADIGNDAFHISVRFGADTFRKGMDPVNLLRELLKIGDSCKILCVEESIPLLNDKSFDPESCYMGFEINLVTVASKREIEGVFEFVKDESVIYVLPPRSKVGEYVELIKELPEEDLLVGQYLLKSGAITETELDHILEVQRSKGGLIGELIVEEKASHREVVDAALSKQREVRERSGTYIRVNASKLEGLIDLVGEMVITGASVYQLSRESGQGALLESSSKMYRLMEELRERALGLRMVPIGEVFNRFHRLVRDISRELGKEISLVITGGDTELDRTMVEKINDPLVHLVRNAMDHGIERADERVKRGKPSRGTIHLNAYHDAGCIVIEVSDDGNGLSRERILSKAIERGIISEGQRLSEQEVYQLIFEPGFSTARSVSDLSGRGIGMDVVRKNVEGLRGVVDVSSEEGKGTKVSIRLPLTLAIIDGFLVKVGGSSFVIPMDMVVECVELTEGVRANGRCDFINLRGEVLPYIHLGSFFGRIDGGDRENIVVIQYGGMKAGIVVDELLGEIQSVIKPMGRVFQGLRGISSATILGNGEVALILDVPGLISWATRRESGIVH